MHHQGYAHLDIKLENILLDQFYNIKVGDLGSAVDVDGSAGRTSLLRGTRFYLPPEVDHLVENQTYNAFSADVYTIGISLFLLLLGDFPDSRCFQPAGDDQDQEMSDEPSWGQSTAIKPKWNGLSISVRSLITVMTEPDPKLRPNIHEVLQSDWIVKPFSPEICADVFKEMS